MSHDLETKLCAGCGAEILLAPVIQGDREYCCEDCLNALPCECAKQQEWAAEQRADTRATEPSGPY